MSSRSRQVDSAVIDLVEEFSNGRGKNKIQSFSIFLDKIFNKFMFIFGFINDYEKIEKYFHIIIDINVKNCGKSKVS